MKRRIKLQLAVKRHEYQDIIYVDIDRNSNPEWTLNLCLLDEDLAEAITLTDDASQFKLEISRVVGLEGRGKVFWETVGAKLLISQRELEYWKNFFLSYYRDGIGAVDHIDVDIPPDDSNTTKGLFLVLKIPDSAPPISEEELRRRLG